MPGRITVFVYGVVCYLIFLGSFLYAIGFIGGVAVPKSIDSGRDIPLTQAITIDAGLLGLFAIQLSGMARRWFRRVWTRVIPEPAERSTYLLFSSLLLLFLFWQWRPISRIVWNVEADAGRTAVYAIYAAGWLTLLASTFRIRHFDLFGVRQAFFYLLGKPHGTTGFRTLGRYRYIRHSLCLGWLMVFWAAPIMTVAHLIFAIATTSYILLAVQFEQRDLKPRSAWIQQVMSFRSRIGN